MSGRPLRANLLGSYGPWADGITSTPGELSFSRTVEAGTCGLEEWKRQGRARVREMIGPLPAGDPDTAAPVPQARCVRRLRHDGLDVEEIIWQLPYGPPTEAVFLAPAGVRRPLPGVLALHDHGGVKRFGWAKIAQTGPNVLPAIADHRLRYYGHAAWANELAHRGFGVLAHDVFPFGSRRVRAADVPAHVAERLIADPTHLPSLTAESMEPGRRCQDIDPPEDGPPERHNCYEGFAGRHEDVVARSLLAMGLTLPGVTLSEDLAALCVLAARPEIDPSRLGCCGLSGGGLRTCFLAGLSDSLRCAVTAGFMSTWKDFALWNSYIHTWGLFIPHLARFLDFPEILALRAPLPSLVLVCDGDLIFDPLEVRRAEAMLAAVYRHAGAAENARIRHYCCPHSFGRAMQGEAFAWLARRLAPDLAQNGRGIDVLSSRNSG